MNNKEIMPKIREVHNEKLETNNNIPTGTWMYQLASNNRQLGIYGYGTKTTIIYFFFLLFFNKNLIQSKQAEKQQKQALTSW